MFNEPLENPNSATLTGQLAALCDAYNEFHNYCAYVCHAQSLIDKEPMELDTEIAEGVYLSGRCLRDRSEAIMERLNTLHQQAKKELGADEVVG